MKRRKLSHFCRFHSCPRCFGRLFLDCAASFVVSLLYYISHANTHISFRPDWYTSKTFVNKLSSSTVARSTKCSAPSLVRGAFTNHPKRNAFNIAIHHFPLVVADMYSVSRKCSSRWQCGRTRNPCLICRGFEGSVLATTPENEMLIRSWVICYLVCERRLD